MPVRSHYVRWFSSLGAAPHWTAAAAAHDTVWFQVPLRWLKLLEVLLGSGKDRATLVETMEAAAHLQIVEEAEVLELLHLFSSVGLLMHYDTPGLRDAATSWCLSSSGCWT
jgi:hypothetical protein